MADDNKKDISIDVKIDPFGECKKKGEVPPWFAARPKLLGQVNEVQIKDTLKLDTRKWKKKDLEGGVYAIAKYDLAVFSTSLSTIEKEIDKVFDASCGKKKRDAKFYKGHKPETKDEAAVLNSAEKKVATLWKKLAKSINDKTSLALEEVANDKGDNKKAIAVGKQALKVFDGVDTESMFAQPITDVLTILKRLGTDLGKGNVDSEDAHKAALRDLRDLEGEYDYVAKSTGKVAKMFIALGEKLTKDKKSDPEIQKFGERITKGKLKSSLETLTGNIKDLGRDIDMIVNFVAKGDHDTKAVMTKASKFKGDHDKKKGSAKAITSEMRVLGAEFKKLEKKLK